MNFGLTEILQKSHKMGTRAAKMSVDADRGRCSRNIAGPCEQEKARERIEKEREIEREREREREE